MPAGIDWAGLHEEATELFASEIRHLLEGGAADAQRLASSIAQDMVLALRAHDLDWQDQLTDQLKVLGEIQRIRLDEASWDVVARLVLLVAQAIKIGLVSGGLL